MEETWTRTPPEFLFCMANQFVASTGGEGRKLTRLPARTLSVEAVWPTAQWAAVTTVLAFNNEPPQKWEPLFCRLTMKGKWPEEDGAPPTMSLSSVPGLGVGAAKVRAGIASARKRSLNCIVTARRGEAGLDLRSE